ncbi:MAG: nucleoside triphosphate pyrophosphohydrolase [Ruminococcaceae bacterium]|nr:nucleoside triphosphate pyrophosphohydrolase [Oscillospiraceae bacterium]
MITGFQFKDQYTIEDLLQIMEILRSPGGCPWDAEQTHESIKKDLIEETYEVIEAINKKSSVMLQEELGDLLMQVVFHSRLSQEAGEFAFAEVCDGICKKLVERHPHVFGEVNVSDTDEVLSNWDAIKRNSKHHETTTQAIDSVPRELPALMRSAKIQHKAAKAGFDWPDVSGAFDKIPEELNELKEAVEKGDQAHIADELGDLLFAVVNVSRFVKVDAEEALTAATDKFRNRFAAVEALAIERGIDMKESSIEELDRLWDEVKRNSLA